MGGHSENNDQRLRTRKKTIIKSHTRKVSLSVVRMTKSYFLFVFSNVIELFYFLFENTLFSLVFGFDSTSGIAVLYTAGIECS